MATVGEKLVDLLADYGVEIVFGIPGTHSIEMYRGLGSGRIRHISPRHEQGGGFMADGYARVSGKPGVCFVITGPGVTNLTTPLGEAYMDSVPMLVISPVNEPDPDEYNQGRLHEITDQSKVTRPLTAFSVTVSKAEEVPQLIAEAFDVFSSQRPCPVHISIPLSIIKQTVEENWQAHVPARPPLASDAAIEAAVVKIKQANRPVLIVGGGCSRQGDAIRQLAEAIPCPVLTTVAARGLVPESFPLSVGAQLRAPYVQEMLEDSDLALFFGTEFAQTDHWNDELKLPQQKIWVNLNSGVDRHGGYSLMIEADAGDCARRISAFLPQASDSDLEKAVKRCTDSRLNQERDLTAKEKQHLAVLNQVMPALPQNTTVVTDMTQIAYTAVDYVPMPRPNSWLHPTGYGTLGYALPAGIGAILANEQNPALVIVGDGGIQYTFQEMTLAAELNLNLVVLLWNNNALLQINDDMDNAGIKPVGVRQQNPDFIQLAEACGWKAAVVESLDSLASDVGKAFDQSGPVLLRLDQDRIPA